MSKKNIIVTGANGQLGRCLSDLTSTYKQYNFIFTDVDSLDICDESAVASFFSEKEPDWVVNVAAYTNVDKAESEPEIAMKINGEAVKYLAQQSRKCGAPLIHISTDYVFDGESGLLIDEDDQTNPINAYGVSKLQGEINARLNPAHVILRTSWLYSQYGHNFVKTIRGLATERDEISVVNDQWGTPTSAIDLAEAIMKIITLGDNSEDVVGTFNFSNIGATCWSLFAEQIIEYSSLQCKVNHIPSSDYPTAAKRPSFSLLNSSKIKNQLSIDLHEWEASLEVVIDKLNH
ncbi:MAG: dTDP-4-dehydrorhamnose reductase [Rikenellaceae bacterium]